MRVTPLDIPGALVIDPDVFRDPRGVFLETYHQRRYEDAGIAGPFVQDNYSWSVRGTLRGLHFQEPHAQGKLVMVVEGTVYDVVVDVRKGSPSFGAWYGTELSPENRRQLYSSGLCAWILRDKRGRGVSVQVHGFLFAERRAGHPVERPGPRHRLADREADPLDQRSGLSNAGRDGWRIALLSADPDVDPVTTPMLSLWAPVREFPSLTGEDGGGGVRGHRV